MFADIIFEQKQMKIRITPENPGDHAILDIAAWKSPSPLTPMDENDKTAPFEITIDMRIS